MRRAQRNNNSLKALCFSIAIAAAMISGCERARPPEAATPTPAPVVQAPVVTLPVSINALMVSLVDHSARPIWSAAAEPPRTDKDWGELEYAAWQIMIAGTVMKLPGTGPADAAWVAQPEWIAFADKLTSAGQDALAAAQTKNVAKYEALGDKIVEICEACHLRFKPDLPTGKILLRYP